MVEVASRHADGAGVAFVSELLSTLDRPRGGERIALRTVIIAAHPDDEVVGAGARLRWHDDLHIVHVTDGAPRDGRDAAAAGASSCAAYARLRRDERARAMAMVGIGAARIHDLGVPDQEASLGLVALTTEIVALLSALDADVVLTHPYEGGHPDHDATAFAVHAALAVLRANGEAVPPLLEMTSYHAGENGIVCGEFLPCAASQDLVTQLDDREQAQKRALFSCYASQASTLRYFDVRIERTRLAPRYDFGAPPHAGRLFYEHFDWKMSGDRWRALAREAARALGLAGGRA